MDRKQTSLQDMLQQAQKEKRERVRAALITNVVPVDIQMLVSLVKRRAQERGIGHAFSDVDLAWGSYFEEGPATDFCEHLL